MKTMLLAAALALVLPASVARAAEAPYGLDDVDRSAPARGPVTCPKVPMTRYEGAVVRYHSPVWVYTGFVERLKRFEEVVRDVAKEVYGRAPKVIRHIGTYNCRKMSGYDLISEHGLGNGIDVAGFDFAPLSAKQRKKSKLPRALQRGFEVRLEKHWGHKRGVAAIHAKFLDRLARRLVARKDIFRVLLGPSYPGHHNHFHFDVSPWRLVDIWE